MATLIRRRSRQGTGFDIQKRIDRAGIMEVRTTTAHSVQDSEAAQFNRLVLKKLRKAVDVDPEVNLISKLPSNYSSRLADRKKKSSLQDESRLLKQVGPEDPDHDFPADDVRNKLKGISSAVVIFPLADCTQSILHTDSLDLPLVDRIHSLIKQSPVMWKPQIGCHKIVLAAGPSIALKVIRDMNDTTEYTMLQYLEKHLPDVPAPRFLGLVAFGDRHSLLFMSLMPGTTLEAVWSSLDQSLKRSVQEQLNDVFTSLRSFRPTEGKHSFRRRSR
ncbi:hypothetical protein TI39_contig4257g00003 [Zymoseptoria brevis]|uniref:Uncharacterized protein n=1 Tax=Zymoseptoria brevis TaxID=1047168 RepID=A0A0F4G8S1_9PEZI|nr:hypothetical protein TI39_contig4257g00003 [Zymoseptoria brevis]